MQHVRWWEMYISAVSVRFFSDCDLKTASPVFVFLNSRVRKAVEQMRSNTKHRLRWVSSTRTNAFNVTARLKTETRRERGSVTNQREREEVFQQETGEDEEEVVVARSKDSWGVSKESRNILIAIGKQKEACDLINGELAQLSPGMIPEGETSSKLHFKSDWIIQKRRNWDHMWLIAWYKARRVRLLESEAC